MTYHGTLYAPLIVTVNVGAGVFSPPELYAVEEPYRRIVEEVAAYVAERGALEKEKYNELYGR